MGISLNEVTSMKYNGVNVVSIDLGGTRIWPVETVAEYLTFTSSTPMTIIPSSKWNATTKQYSLDNGATWVDYASGSISGTKVMFRGLEGTIGSGGTSWILNGENISASGPIDSILDYEDVAAGRHPLMDEECYAYMFADCSALISPPELPSPTLSAYCYEGLFLRTSITTPPQLPAEDLVGGCYLYMFSECENLHVSRTTGTRFFKCGLPIDDSVVGMFEETSGPYQNDPLVGEVYYYVTSIANVEYFKIYSDCEGIPVAVRASENWNATEMEFSEDEGTSWNRYSGGTVMGPTLLFRGYGGTVVSGGSPWVIDPDNIGCRLVKISGNIETLLNYDQAICGVHPTMGADCYAAMFMNNRMLVSAPDLPAVDLTERCYMMMFGGCVGLSKPPVIATPTTTADSCYSAMFSGCRGLIVNNKTDYPGLSSFFTCPSSVDPEFIAHGMFDSVSDLLPQDPSPVAGVSYGYSDMVSAGYVTVVSADNRELIALIEGWEGDLTEYSIDGGVTWNQYDRGSYVRGACIQFRGTNCIRTGAMRINGGDAIVSGDTASMIDYMSLVTGTPIVLTTDTPFASMFRDNDSVISAENLVISVPDLIDNCCSEMFSNCVNLTKPPQITSTTAGIETFLRMFYNCRSLTSAPSLSTITSLGNYCCSSMFEGCVNLLEPPELPATTLGEACYAQMFYGCAALSYAPLLPALTVPVDCYNSMFSSCESLTESRGISATSVGDYALLDMFLDCTSLVKPPVLSITTVGEQSMDSMFMGCKNLLVSGTYGTTFFTCPSDTACGDMFSGIGGPISGTPVQGSTYKFLDGVQFITFKSSDEISVLVRNTYDATSTEYSTDDGATWEEYTPGDTLTGENGSLMLRGRGGTKCTYDTGMNVPWVVTGSEVHISGSIESLLDYEKFGGRVMPSVANAAYTRMFEGQTSIYDASGLVIHSVPNYACKSMFSGCTNLNSTATVITDTIGTRGLTSMYSGCTNLTVAKSITCESIGDYGCYMMFNGCSNLLTAPTMNITNSVGSYGCSSMFNGCSSLIDPPEELGALTLGTYAYAVMFANCYDLVAPPIIKATSVAMSAFSSMFLNCYSIYVTSDPQDTKFVTIASTFPSDAASDMFSSTAGEVLGTPSRGSSYYFRDTGGKCITIESISEDPIGIRPSSQWIDSENKGRRFVKIDDGHWTKWTGSTNYLTGTIFRFRSCKASQISSSTSSWSVQDNAGIRISGVISNFYKCSNGGEVVLPDNFCSYFMSGATTGQIDAYELSFPDTVSVGMCYNMFSNTGIIAGPYDLPATVGASNCYASMFKGCPSLMVAPVIRLNELAQQSCQSMFENCIGFCVSHDEGTGEPFFWCPDTTPTSCVANMFAGTGGAYTDDPVEGEVYFYYY